MVGIREKDNYVAIIIDPYRNHDGGIQARAQPARVVQSTCGDHVI